MVKDQIGFFKSNTYKLRFSKPALLKRYSNEDRCTKKLTEICCEDKNGRNVSQIKKGCTCIVIISIVKTLGDTFFIDCVGSVVSRLDNDYFSECYHKIIKKVKRTWKNRWYFGKWRQIQENMIQHS